MPSTLKEQRRFPALCAAVGASWQTMSAPLTCCTPAASQKLAPEWESAAKTFKAQGDPKIVLANVDCTLDENKALSEKFGIQGFPTIKVCLTPACAHRHATCACNRSALQCCAATVRRLLTGLLSSPTFYAACVCWPLRLVLPTPNSGFRVALKRV